MVYKILIGSDLLVSASGSIYLIDLVSEYVIMDTQMSFISYHPCIKYQMPADSKLDGTETFFIAESMHFVDVQARDEQTRSLSKLVHGP